MSSQNEQKTVRSRRVFYMPGYDPIHPRRYRELYRTEGAAQAGISGYDIQIRAKTGSGPFGWHITSTQNGITVQTDVEVLVWSDIVRDSMETSIAATYLQLLRTVWIYLSTGVLWRLMRLRKGPVIAALYPIGMLILQLAAALLTAWGLTALVWNILGWAGLLPASVAFWALLRWFRRIDNRLFAYYLMHDYAYSARRKGATSTELNARLSEFSQTILKALRDEFDEVLVVGHSSGAHLGAMVVADALRHRGERTNGPALSFLSLGQVVPMVSFLPKAQRLRKDLRFLSESNDLTWVDVSAPGDGCTFALCDPVAVSGVTGPKKRWPLVLSAAFTQTLSRQKWRAMRWRFFRLHFQYMCAFDKPGDYDYFRVTAGPKTLGQRFENRSPSRSRIETPVSKFTSVSA